MKDGASSTASRGSLRDVKQCFYAPTLISAVADSVTLVRQKNKKNLYHTNEVAEDSLISEYPSSGHTEGVVLVCWF